MKHLLSSSLKRKLNKYIGPLAFTVHQGTDEPVLLQVPVQECGVLIREEQNPTVLQSGYSRRQHGASERLHGG